ncbi:MAG: hypothetical protein KDK10_00490, partial [Maritimibacter sp.]|nr:hypothetical protein [Maritimibacter sp.]
MTTSEWGSTGSPRADFHYGHRQQARGYGQGGGGQFSHPVNALRPTRAAKAQAQAQAHPGFGAPQAYGTLPGAQDARYDDPWDDTRASRPSTHAAAPGAPLARTLNLMGGLISVLLIVGLALWGYKLAVRDVSGVPVVRALEGPMRIAPDEPGGDVALHQGLAVNGVAGEGASAGPVDKVTLAPATLDLAEDDVPVHPMLPPAGATASDPAAAGAVKAALDPAAEAEAHRNAVDAAV